MQLRQSEARVRAKEVLCEKATDKLRTQIEVEKANKERDRKAFLRIQKRPPQVHRVQDQQLLEVVSAYEGLRSELLVEAAQLRAQLKSLLEDHRHLANAAVAQRSRGSSHSLPGPEPTWVPGGPVGMGAGVGADDAVLRMADQLQASNQEIEASRAREARLKDQAKFMAKEIDQLRQKLETEEAACENVRLELASRPTARSLQEARQEAKALRGRLAQAEGKAREATDLAALKKSLSTRQLVARDRENHRLGLDRLGFLEELPRDLCRDLLQSACRALMVSDVTLIQPAIEKMAKAVSLLPRLEKFVRAVSDLAATFSPADNPHGPVLEDCLPVLEAMRARAADAEGLESLRAKLGAALAGRPVKAQQGGRLSTSSDDGELVACVAELVALEAQLVAKAEAYEAAELEVQEAPNLLAHQIARHFQHLFQVKKLEGVLPKMNELYIYCSETNTMLKALSSTFGLTARASPKTLLLAVQQSLAEKQESLSSGGSQSPL